MNRDIQERPILFNGDMVRAILDGRKTVTRRSVKGIALEWLRPDGFTPEFTASPGNGLCPYGQPGDRLWVRESFGLQVRRDGCGGTGEFIVYRASAPDAVRYVSASGKAEPIKWKPSIHMPRHSSRILLEITAVRVERLQDITRPDIRAEGLQCPPELASDDTSPNYRDWYPAAWRDLWNSTGGDWDANPWVWVVEFKRVTP